ncbi:NUDIX domain-containing protein [Nocardia stercoris]|uniref:NUDIX hydrolase n=1 Tax=Nocardia stercoris TaxID=2483361 RepID=A0A3M2L6X0_9NOCA|nr:NUDIX hydrolase [Nocardia stercoris]RMI32736.1 NUDIX hydrolase [Nocardia stercoris]
MTTAADLALARLAAGALFVRDESVLLVHKTYGNGWDLPGGYVEPGESPAAACRREVFEELGIAALPHRLLVTDWAVVPEEGDKVLYVFDCGRLDDTAAIVLQTTELDDWRWVPVDAVHELTIPRLAQRIRRAYTAWQAGLTVYLEQGVPAPERRHTDDF